MSTLQELIDNGTFKDITHIKSINFPKNPTGTTIVGVAYANDTNKKIFIVCDEVGNGLAFHASEARDIIHLLNTHFSA